MTTQPSELCCSLPRCHYRKRSFAIDRPEGLPMRVALLVAPGRARGCAAQRSRPAGLADEVAEMVRLPEVGGPPNRHSAVGLSALDITVSDVSTDEQSTTSGTTLRARLNNDQQATIPPSDSSARSSSVTETAANSSSGYSPPSMVDQPSTATSSWRRHPLIAWGAGFTPPG